MSELKLPRLLAAAKEFNLGQDTLVEILRIRGFDINGLTATSKLTEEMYVELKDHFENGSLKYKKEQSIYDSPVELQIGKHTLPIALISVCIDTKSTYLELGNCDLNEENLRTNSFLSNLLKKCANVEELILSNEWCKPGTNIYTKSKNGGKANRLYTLPDFISWLPNLKVLICCGDEKKHWGIKDLTLLNKLKNLIHIDFSYNKISSLNTIDVLPTLKSLNLRSNKIDEFSEFPFCPNLEILLLGENQINYVNKSIHLIFLIQLELRNNKIESLSDFQHLPNLKFLDLSGNLLFNTMGINNLVNLIELNLSFNKIYEVNHLEEMTNLKILNLQWNEIQYIEGLDDLTALEELNLNNNGISEIDGLSHLLSLHTLILSNNFISEIESVKELKSLKILHLNHNTINNINALQYLPLLEELALKENEIEDISSILKLKNLHTVYLADNPILENIPEEVIEVGWQAIRDRLIAGNLTTIKEVKLLLLGNTNVGKSNLLEYLETGKEPEGKESTHGIQYKSLDKLIKGTSVHCWDFGGQEYFHATHQLFFSPGALHVILWSKTMCKEIMYTKTILVYGIG